MQGVGVASPSLKANGFHAAYLVISGMDGIPYLGT